MSVASSSLVNPTRTKALMVRLSPYLVEAVCELTRALKDKTHAQTEISGLLFGKSQDGLLTVEALKTFKDSSGPRSDLARRERMEKAFTAAMALANEDPEFAAYKLLGWFSLRGGGGLINSDIEFHNRHFKNAEDVALIVWREGDTQITAELYAAVETGKLTTEDYRWSSVRLSTELRHVSQPVDLVMRVRMNDDLYLRTYGVADKNERKEEWKKIADNAKRAFLSFLPGRGHSEVVFPEDLPPPPKQIAEGKRSFESRTLFRDSPDPTETALPPKPVRPTPAAAAAAPPVVAPPKPVVKPPAPPVPPPTQTTTTAAPGVVTRSIVKPPTEPPAAVVPYQHPQRTAPVPEISGLPVLYQTRKAEPKTTPWLSMGLVFIACSGLTFAVLALRNAGSSDGKLSQVMKVLFPGSDLELHAESRGDSLWLQWNRHNPVVSNAAGAVLSVTDGPKHFERRLDPDIVSEGVVSYKPVSGDVTFQLKVTGMDQSIAFGKLRVLDATSPATAEVKPVLDLSSPSPTAASSLSTTAPPPASSVPSAPRNTEATNKLDIPSYIPPPPLTTPQPKQSNNKPPTPAPQPQVQQQQPPAQTAQQAAPPPVTPAPKTAAPRPTTTTSTPATAPSTSNTAINGWDPNLPENKPAAPTAQQQAQTQAAPPDSKTIDFVGPKVLLQVMPNTRNLTPGLITEVTRVEVEVRVDNSGHVKSAHLTNPNVKNQLGSEALKAAKQWTFQPATLRGQHVESDHTIVFEFRPEGQ
jgi:TonB family protein